MVLYERDDQIHDLMQIYQHYTKWYNNTKWYKIHWH